MSVCVCVCIVSIFFPKQYRHLKKFFAEVGSEYLQGHAAKDIFWLKDWAAALTLVGGSLGDGSDMGLPNGQPSPGSPESHGAFWNLVMVPLQSSTEPTRYSLGRQRGSPDPVSPGTIVPTNSNLFMSKTKSKQKNY